MEALKIVILLIAMGCSIASMAISFHIIREVRRIQAKRRLGGSGNGMPAR